MPLPNRPPGRRHRDDVVHSRDRDRARDLISAVFSPHTLEVVGPVGDLDVFLQARRTPSITIAELRHGTEVLVRPGALESYFEINMPIRGHTLSTYGREEIESGPGRAVILSATRSSSMRWSGDCAQVAVKISRALIERTLEGVLGYPPDEAVQFAVGFDGCAEPA